MKDEEYSDLVSLGKLQAIDRLLGEDIRLDKDLSRDLATARKIIFEVLTEHWDLCNDYLTPNK